ncbi:MAG: hypothetical protein F4065_05305 [Rhodothermaceae bacterium]|nr:hypothetical protein [Rhodothermaceae bacterium]MXZ59000.1 hypothetical protein [Rhodothermaceae bacterium]MYB91909.1 hypothetical protein [Rhodothermaceae bacterium]MYD67043.1 hypothetical protein [Rhodothermaceae bacterium]MYG44488.1 hypothetical protein [Rhodothermaceae bacterium]
MKEVLASLLILSTVLARVGGAQDTLQTEFEVIAQIPEARSLAIDPEGLIYVVSASELLQLDHLGEIKARLDGTNAGVFGELSDVDPGNGLIWVLADAEKGNLFRFSKELLHLETIRVPRNTDRELGHSPRLDLQGGFSTALGQPIAVATGVAGELFAIDASSQRVLKWDASRRLERVIGEFGSGAGQLVEPISLTTDASSLYVADRALGLVKVYDYFGGHIRNLKAESDPNSITVTQEGLWIIFPQSIWIYSHQGILSRQMVIPLDDPLIAAVPLLDSILLLTPIQLLRLEI